MQSSSSAIGTAPDGFGGQAQQPMASAPFAPVARGDIPRDVRPEFS